MADSEDPHTKSLVKSATLVAGVGALAGLYYFFGSEEGPDTVAGERGLNDRTEARRMASGGAPDRGDESDGSPDRRSSDDEPRQASDQEGEAPGSTPRGREPKPARRQGAEHVAPAGDAASGRDAGAWSHRDARPHGTLEKEAIQAGMKEMKPVLQRCYESVLEEFPEASGTVTVSFRIVSHGGQGRVDYSKIDQERTTMYHSELRDCLTENVGKIEFPAPDGNGAVEVNYPLNFKSSGDGDAGQG